jgi:beta-N-acetylhexosaminidase
MRSSLITGLAGPALTADEAAFLRDSRPMGIILFLRNCASHDQIRALVADAKTAIGAEDLLVLIDQEGGRVQRLRPPLGRALPPAAAYAALYSRDRDTACRYAFDAARLVAEDLLSLGINTDCAPVLDVPVEGSHDIIGDRAYGKTPDQVAALGRAVAEGFLAGGVLPVIKHIPGHGRATKDSHHDLPVVTTPHAELTRTDFAAFKLLAHMPAAMTAHVVFTDLDDRAPASTSQRVTRDIIRGEIGFDGLLMSDDLSMKALTGSIRQRAEAVIRAGSDVALHCNGDLGEMSDAAAGVPRLAGDAARRCESAFTAISTRKPFDLASAEASLAAILESHTRASESV